MMLGVSSSSQREPRPCEHLQVRVSGSPLQIRNRVLGLRSRVLGGLRLNIWKPLGFRIKLELGLRLWGLGLTRNPQNP